MYTKKQIRVKQGGLTSFARSKRKNTQAAGPYEKEESVRVEER